MENTKKVPQEVIDILIKWNEEWEVYDTNRSKFSKPKSANYIIEFVLKQCNYVLDGNTEIRYIINNNKKSKGLDIRFL